MNNYTKISINIIFSCLGIAFFYGCSTQKDNATNRGLQNLSARYNYIYNSNVLLNTYQEDLSITHKDNYDNLLTIYIAPEITDYTQTNTPDKSLAEITLKAQAIISEKNLSNYIDEAYMLLGKTNFYNGSYFTATAYFDYAAKTYKENKKVNLDALNWKARSLMQLNDYEAAAKILDTVYFKLDSVNTGKAEPLATLAQMSIYTKSYKNAIKFLEQAIKESNKIQSRTRWPYILAQLYELEKEYNASLRNYTKVENSNAPFEMYFNAKLSKIRINDLLNNQGSNRKLQLLKLLKDDKNFDYTDQIYYEVAEDYLADTAYLDAEKYYKLSAEKSTTNPYQKGISYLKLAELNFKHLRNYVSAKLYYDSAASVLPKNYDGYESILKKAQNLEYLTERYQIIAAQDTLQMFAKLLTQERARKLDEMFEPKKEVAVLTKATNNGKVIKEKETDFTKQNNGTFYFSNNSAISKGFTDFKKRWGNRLLEENWRQSVKSSAQINQQTQAATIGNNTTSEAIQANSISDKEEKIKAYAALIPANSDQLIQSDQKIINAYFEIASFYQQVLEDEPEAIKVYEILLARYPENNHLNAIYYSLYLGYRATDEIKSNSYKNLVLSKFPGSLYAKTILDPNFSAKQNALDVEVNKAYNAIFNKYEQKDFLSVINDVEEINQRFPGNNLQAQYDYLKAIAIGRTQNVDTLMNAFSYIIAKYPNDQLINPLVKDHISYINDHIATFKPRKIALIDFDPTEPRFIAQQEKLPSVTIPANTTTEPNVTAPKPIIIEPKAVVPPTITPNNTVKQIDTNAIIIKSDTPTVTPIAKKFEDNFFSKAESTVYYYVIDVADMTVSVSSSRFGVGQFNRGNFSGTGLKHQLLELEENQLIYVGNFATLADVKTYSNGITQQLSKIMKVPASSYRGFYITKENFEKIKDRETLNRYLEFFKNNNQ